MLQQECQTPILRSASCSSAVLGTLTLAAAIWWYAAFAVLYCIASAVLYVPDTVVAYSAVKAGVRRVPKCLPSAAHKLQALEHTITGMAVVQR